MVSAKPLAFGFATRIELSFGKSEKIRNYCLNIENSQINAIKKCSR